MSDVSLTAPSPVGVPVFLTELPDDGTTKQHNRAIFTLDGEEIEVFWLDPQQNSNVESSVVHSTPVKFQVRVERVSSSRNATEPRLLQAKSKGPVGSISRLNRPFKSPLASTENTPNSVALKRAHLAEEVPRRSNLGPSKRRKLPADPELSSLEERKVSLLSDVKDAKDKLRQLQLLAKENVGPITPFRTSSSLQPNRLFLRIPLRSSMP
jgi:hypothetical protein